MKFQQLKSRRDFLRASALGVSLSWTAPSFIQATFAALRDEQEQAGAPTDAERILVVVQLAGGNDGLNTVVPFSDDRYYEARPRLAVKRQEVLRLNDQVGFHPALRELNNLFAEGQVGIIQGAGYPNPNRSHFRSMEIWHTASDANAYSSEGWLGRYFDHACGGADPTVGVALGKERPQAFASASGLGVSLSDPARFRLISSDRPRQDETAEAEEFLRRLNEDQESVLAMDEGSESGASIGEGAGMRPKGMRALDFLERVSVDAQVSSDRIREIGQRAKNEAGYPASRLAESLKLVARLIGGGLGARVYYVSHGGFDTHTNQLAAHDRLLREFSQAIGAFQKDLRSQGLQDRVLTMSFSEFGRRVAENANAGTDHGAAAPMFLIGDKVNSGVLTPHPSLAKDDLFRGDLRHSIDFRSVYAGVLERWLRASSEPILGREFPPFHVVG